MEQKFEEIVNGIIEENKKKGSVSLEQLLEKLDKIDATPQEIEEVYVKLDQANIQVINEFERDKELYDQLLKEISMDDPVKMYLKDIGKVALLSPEDETELARRMMDGDEPVMIE